MQQRSDTAQARTMNATVSMKKAGVKKGVYDPASASHHITTPPISTPRDGLQAVHRAGAGVVAGAGGRLS